MTRILILGANGQLARNTTKFLLERTDARLTLYLRQASRLRNPDPDRVTIEGRGGTWRDVIRYRLMAASASDKEN